jgi:hypothetical protein
VIDGPALPLKCPRLLKVICVNAEQTGVAWQLASRILTGAALSRALEHVVRALAEACVRAQQQEHGSSDGWVALRCHLAAPISGPYGGVLRVAAVDAILSADRRMSPPAWLLEPFQACTSMACSCLLEKGLSLQTLPRYSGCPFSRLTPQGWKGHLMSQI